MATQKILALDDKNRIVSSANDPRQGAEFAVKKTGKNSLQLNVYVSGHWHSICQSNVGLPYFALCNLSDSNIVEEPTNFLRTCYSHWTGIPFYSECSVFGLRYTGNGHYLTVNSDGLLRADGGTELGLLKVNDYSKSFMFVDPRQPDDAKGQRLFLKQHLSLYKN